MEPHHHKTPFSPSRAATLYVNYNPLTLVFITQKKRKLIYPT